MRGQRRPGCEDPSEPLETALVAATELDREQLEQLRDQVAALLEALPPPAPAPVVKPNAERSPYLAGLPEGPRGGGAIEWKWHRQGKNRYRAVSVPAGPSGRAAALDLSPSVSSGYPCGGYQRWARQPERLSRLVPVPGELAQAGRAVAQPGTLQHRHDEIAHSGHRLRGGTTPNLAGILTERDVAHVVQLVLDRPMRAAQAEQVRWPGPLRGQAGDLVMHLGAPAPFPLALVHQSADLPETRPDDPLLLQAGSRVERPNVDAPVPTVNRPCARRVLDRFERSAAAPAGAPVGCA